MIITQGVKTGLHYILFGSYNDGKRGFEGWTKDHEIKLLELIDKLNKQGVRIALSNNLKYNNPYLDNWLGMNYFVDDATFKIHYLKGDYVNCNYHKIDRSKDVEVLITNY